MRLLLGPRIELGPRTLFVIERMEIVSSGRARMPWVTGRREVHALLLRDEAGLWAVGPDGGAIDLAALARALPELARQLAL